MTRPPATLRDRAVWGLGEVEIIKPGQGGEEGKGYPEFNPDQPRDESGRWSSGSGSTAVAEEPSGGTRVSPLPPTTAEVDLHKGKRGEQIWNEYVFNERGVTPEEAARALAHVPAGWKVTGDLRDSGEEGGVEFVMDFEDEEGDIVGEMQRTLDLKQGIAVHENFQLVKEHQGRGLGKDILRQQVALYQKIGINRVELTANGSVGKYAWARYGFVPSSTAEWEGLGDVYKDRAWPRDVSDLAQKLLSGPPQNIRLLAAHPAGKAMLLEGPAWYGRLDLNDRDSMEVFKRYVSRQ